MSQGNEKPDGSTSIDQILLNQCLNISNYMYYGQYTSYDDTQLQSEIDLKPLDVGGKPYEKTLSRKGLFEEAFITTGSGPKSIVIGYEGTDLDNKKNPHSDAFTAGQIIDDGCIVAGTTAPSFVPAARFASKVLTIAGKKHISAGNVFLTGHSLGAAEAEYAAASTGLSGYTFGTPGIVAPADAMSSQLQNYVDYGDPVGNYANDGPDLYGAKGDYPPVILSPSILHYGATSFLGPESNEKDLTDAIADYRDYNPYALVRFGEALKYHHLSEYATYLHDQYPNVNLYPISGQKDGSTGADANFLHLIESEALGQAPCYAAGTRIRTADGDRPVEHLEVGDLVRTASGDLRPIKWLGHRTVDCGRLADPREARPVRIAADAFGAERPARDLLVSPGHAICIDAMGEVLVPAGALIDGDSVVQLQVGRVTYWHVELDSHDILIAENLPAESYLDMGNRGFFAEAEATALHAAPDAAAVTHAAFCRPFVAEGPVLEVVRAVVRARAASLARSRQVASSAA